MDNNVGNEEEKVPVESSGATNKPSKKQVYLDYMRSRMGESYGEDEDSVYSDMLDYRQKNDESQERMTEILSKDPRLAQVLSDMAGGKRGQLRLLYDISERIFWEQKKVRTSGMICRMPRKSVWRNWNPCVKAKRNTM